jgi:phage baseplate assembly protein W
MIKKPTYKGFTSRNKCGMSGRASGFSITDTQLIVQDFINALNINQGELVGRPQVGTTLRSFIFEPNVKDLSTEIAKEIARVAAQDTRLIIGTVNVNVSDHAIAAAVEIAISPNNQVVDLNLNISTLTGIVSSI